MRLYIELARKSFQLAFMPDWLQTLCRATPFPGFVDTPVEIYLGRAQGIEAINLIVVQFLWLIVMISLGRLLTKVGHRKLTIQGG